ncbi:MAG: Nramp family divalent metal transporter [Bryobacterales bacterium]|nr:Nramp family divalent metal transporter [Bryobacteraceae bacterium]MDW8353917.1 Nramp family divalent metal transporter [Bryobacterales bacterium]
MVFAVAALGPQDLVTNAAAGASYGYGLLWTVALVVAARYVMLEATARYVVVTGESLMTGYARAGRWAPWLILVSIGLKRHLLGLSHLLLLGSSLELLLGARSGWVRTAGALACWAAGFALMYWGRYPVVEKASRPLMAVLGGALALAALLSRPDPAAVVRGVILPMAPAGQGAYGTAFLLLALLGSGAGALSNLKYAAFVHEKGWRGVSDLRLQRTDLLLSGIGFYLMLLSVQVAAAAALYPSAAPLREVADLLPIFSTTLGDAGRILLGVGLWAAVFTTYTGATTGYSLLVADIWHNVLRPASAYRKEALGNSPAYRVALVIFSTSPLYALLTDWEPLWLVLTQSAVLAALVPVLGVILIWLTNDRRRMGPHANGWIANFAMGLVLLAIAGLSVYNLRVWFGARAFSGS